MRLIGDTACATPHYFASSPIVADSPATRVAPIEMKSPPAIEAVDDSDDIFGPPRTYPSGYHPPKNRPSMISAKYRQKEERRKVLKISIGKLKKIEDPEASLCRSVLINNTMKRLQREARDEKLQKQQLNYPRCYDNEGVPNIKSEFMKSQEAKGYGCADVVQDYSGESKLMESLASKVEFVVETDFDTKLAEEINTVTAGNLEALSSLVEDNLVNESLEASFGSASVEPGGLSVPQPMETNDRFSSRKRSFDDMEDCDVQDVLSQFYMPPTPRMLTCIDDDEDISVVDPCSPSKRVRLDDNSDSFEVPKTNADGDNSKCDKGGADEDFSVNSFINNNIPADRLRFGSQPETDSNAYSCGHASMFSELQSNVYHNLIASLET